MSKRPSVSDRYTFPRPPSSDATEWPGTAIGAGNTLTHTRAPTTVYDRTIDRVDGRREGLVGAAITHLTKRAGREALFRHDAVIHGIRVRATTNSPHLYDFWVDNWYSPDEWKIITGLTPPREPRVTVYAVGGITDQPQAAYYSHRSRTILVFNTAYYGQLKSWVLGAVGRVLAEEFGVHAIFGSCVEQDGKGILILAPTGAERRAAAYGLLASPGTRFHSDEWVFVRYTYATRDGSRLHPLRVRLRDGSEVRGFAVFRWLETEAAIHPDATVVGLDIEHREQTLPVTGLDFAEPVRAQAFTSEKILYLPTSLVDHFPTAAAEMLRSKLENVPDVADDALARLRAFEGARVMLDMSRVLPPERVFTSPMEPAVLAAVFFLRGDHEAAPERLGPAALRTTLLGAKTPEGRPQIAFNAYRAVDEDEEQAFLHRLEAEDPSRDLERRAGVPDTLRAEVELFRTLHRACACYTAGLHRLALLDAVE